MRSRADHRLDPFTQKLVQNLSCQADLAIERVQARDALRDASLHDELTGVGNRRKANERLERLLPGDALSKAAGRDRVVGG